MRSGLWLAHSQRQGHLLACLIGSYRVLSGSPDRAQLHRRAQTLEAKGFKTLYTPECVPSVLLKTNTNRVGSNISLFILHPPTHPLFVGLNLT
jgi:hypothetical protein